MRKKDINRGELATYLQESTSTVRRASITLYVVGAYMIATALEVTHQQLLASNQKISLPLIGVPVDLTSFYFIAPLILLSLQVKFLMHLFAHEDRVLSIRKRYCDSKKDWRSLSNDILPISLFNLTYGYFKQHYLRGFLGVIYFAMNHAFPIGVLLYFQVSFLPYHDAGMTLGHQIVSLLSILFSSLIYLRGTLPKLKRRAILKWIRRYSWVVVISLFFVYTAVLFDFPRSKLENERTILFTDIKLNDLITRNIVIEGESLMSKELDIIQSSNLYFQVLRSMIDVSDLGEVSDYEPKEQSEHLSLLKERSDRVSALIANASKSREALAESYEKGIVIESGRDLRFSLFNGVEMRHSVLNNVDFTGADFMNTDLSFSSVNNTNFTNGIFSGVQFNSSKMGLTNFQGATIEKGDLRNAQLYRADMQDSRIALSNFNGASLIGLNAESSTWIANNLESSNFSLANITSSVFIINQFANGEFRKAELADANFISSEFLSEKFRAVFGYEYLPKKLTPEEIRIGYSYQYSMFQDHANSSVDYYSDSANAFVQLASTLKFFISVKSDSSIPKLSEKQIDEMDNTLSTKTDQNVKLNVVFAKEFSTICSRKDDVAIEASVNELIRDFPVTLTEVKNASRISDEKALIDTALVLRTLYVNELKKTCGVQYFLENLPNRIPYLRSSFPNRFVIGYIELPMFEKTNA